MFLYLLVFHYILHSFNDLCLTDLPGCLSICVWYVLCWRSPATVGRQWLKPSWERGERGQTEGMGVWTWHPQLACDIIPAGTGSKGVGRVGYSRWLCLGLLVLQLGKPDREDPPDHTHPSADPSNSSLCLQPPTHSLTPFCVQKLPARSDSHTYYNAMCFLKHSPLYLTLFYVCVCVCIYVCVCVWSSSAHSDLSVSPLNVIKQTPHWLTCRHIQYMSIYMRSLPFSFKAKGQSPKVK